MTTSSPAARPTPRWVRAIAHPTRIAILDHLLDAGEATPVALSRATGVPLGSVAYHVRRLCHDGQIVLAHETMARGAVVHHYRLADPDRTRAVLANDILADEHPPDGPPGPVAPGASATGRWTTLMRAVTELRTRRKARGVTRAQLAAQIHIKPSLLAGIERGDVDPRLTTLLELADALDTTLAEVFAIAERPDA